MIITGGISYAFFKHGKDTIKEGLEKVTPEHFHKKAESHAYRATHTATQYLVPPGLLRTYQRIPPVLKSGTAALALGVAFYEHGAHLQHKYVGMYTKASVRFSDFKEKVANTFKP
jgi:hypothetical protein